MHQNLRILYPTIFDPSRIVAGVTLANRELIPEKGFSIFPGKILSTEEVEFNRALLAKKLSLARSSLKFQRQVHASHIRWIDKDSPETESDGMITSLPGLALNVTIADCCAVLIHAADKNIVAALHSGWRGTKENISGKGIEMLIKYGCRPENMLVWLSPCASGRNYEVESDVAKFFPKYSRKISDKKYLLDIPSCVSDQLTGSGIAPNNIECSGICTIEDKRFHSYRRDGDKSGRMAAFISMIA